MGLPAIAPYPMLDGADLPTPRVPWKVDPSRIAVLVHDMQNHFVDAFTAGEDPITDLLANIGSVVRAARAADVPVIFSRQPGGQTKEQRGLLQDFWGNGVAPGEYGQAIVADLAPVDGDVVMDKWRYNAFVNTDLNAVLEKAGRDQLAVCGIYAHLGCLMTAADAFMHEIQPFFIADAVADFSAEHHAMAIEYAASRCAVPLTTQAFLDSL